MFPVSVTQQSPAAVSMETYHITLTLPPTQVEGSVGNGVGQGAVQLPQPFQFGSSLGWFWEGRVLGSGSSQRSGARQPNPFIPVPSWKSTWRKSLVRGCSYPGPSVIAQTSA